MGSIPKPPGPPPSPPPRPKPPMPLPPAPSMQKCMASLPTLADARFGSSGPYKAEAEDPPFSAPNRTWSCLLHHHHQTAVRNDLEPINRRPPPAVVLLLKRRMPTPRRKNQLPRKHLLKNHRLRSHRQMSCLVPLPVPLRLLLARLVHTHEVALQGRWPFQSMVVTGK